LNEQGLEISAFVHSTVRFVVIMAFIVMINLRMIKTMNLTTYISTICRCHTRASPLPPLRTFKASS